MDTVYIETSIVSHATAWLSSDPAIAVLQRQAKRWLSDKAPNYSYRHRGSQWCKLFVDVELCSFGEPRCPIAPHGLVRRVAFAGTVDGFARNNSQGILGSHLAEETAMIVDPNVEEVRRVREKLIAQHGGLQGYIRHLQALEKRKKRKTRSTRRKSKK